MIEDNNIITAIVKTEVESEFFSSLDTFVNEDKIISNYGNNSIKTIENLDLEKYRLSNLTLKECEIKNSKIKYSYISENSYLRKTIFNNVDLTGTIFENANLEKAKFEKCDLRYVKFENCILNYNNVLQSKPKEPNLAIALIKSLYKNELQQGNSKNADKLLLLLKKEERILYKKMLIESKMDSNETINLGAYNNPNYYKEEMNRLGLNKFNVFVLLILSYLSSFTWGHGIKISRIFKFMLTMILIFSFLYMCILDKPFMDSILISVKSWVLNNENVECILAETIMIIENYLGMITIAMFTSALYRKIEK